MKPIRLAVVVLLIHAASTAVVSWAQDRNEKVRKDKAEVAGKGPWIYNDFSAAMAQARQARKPLFVVFRCIPCEACSRFDKELLHEDNVVNDLLDRFVCARIVQANHLDLSLFQFDFDQSFHAMFLNADKTVYARFGTRSARKEEQDMSMEGLRATMLAVLKLHDTHPAGKQALVGKQPKATTVRIPEDYPSLKGKYAARLDYEGNVAKSCLHCHQVRDAERRSYRDDGKPIPESVLFPYPLPDVLGLRIDPKSMATIAGVEPESIAAAAGLRSSDTIVSLAGQPILSTADLQWVLHHASATASLPIQFRRGNEKETINATLDMPTGWRARSDISWRATTWDLRRMATGGLSLEEVSESQRKELGLGNDALALRVKHAGLYGEHAAAHRAGIRKGDILTAVDGDTQRRTEGQLIAFSLTKPKGEQLSLTIRRGKQTLKLAFPLQ